MTTRTRHTAALGPAALAAAFVLLCSGATAAGTVSPLPPSAYTVREACPPPSPGHADVPGAAARSEDRGSPCVHPPPGGHRAAPAQPRSPAARAAAPPPPASFGLTPQDLHTAYQLPTSAPSAQTIALVDAYNDLSVEADLEAYDKEFHLPACRERLLREGQPERRSREPAVPQDRTGTGNGARKGSTVRTRRERKKPRDGRSRSHSTSRPPTRSARAATSRSSRPTRLPMKILEPQRTRPCNSAPPRSRTPGAARSASKARRARMRRREPGIPPSRHRDNRGRRRLRLSELGCEKQPGAWLRVLPGLLADVVAVGGTRLSLEPNSTWAGETVWNGDGAGGGGCSAVFEAQPWQQKRLGLVLGRMRRQTRRRRRLRRRRPLHGRRCPRLESLCQTTYEEGGKEEHLPGWCTIGGTSLASPIIASVFALAGGAGEAPLPGQDAV